jgi:hypothetical protein
MILKEDYLIYKRILFLSKVIILIMNVKAITLIAFVLILVISFFAQIHAIYKKVNRGDNFDQKYIIKIFFVCLSVGLIYILLKNVY